MNTKLNKDIDKAVGADIDKSLDGLIDKAIHMTLDRIQHRFEQKLQMPEGENILDWVRGLQTQIMEYELQIEALTDNDEGER